MKSFFLFLFCFVFTACSDYGVTKIPEEPAPDIQASPESVDFGTLAAGTQFGIDNITITNVGNDVLRINDIVLVVGDETFSLNTDFATLLDPGASTLLVIEYIPVTYSDNADKIKIYSNDPDEPIVEIDISGSGDAPVIFVDPDYHMFSDIYVGCDEYIPVTIGNIGNADLILSDINHFASLPADFGLYDYEPYYGMLPLTVSPGTTMTLEIQYTPTDAHSDAGYIEIESNDPFTPLAYSDHDGDGDYERWVTDSFEQDRLVDVDILFVIDNSGSMNSNQTNFKSNFSSFISVFSAAGVDYRIAFITTDDATLVDGRVVTAADSDPVALVDSIVDNIGTTGSPNEAGLHYSYIATQPGAEAGPGGAFFREGARLVIIYVSDEPDHSSYRSTMSSSDYANQFRALKTSDDLVIAHAVAGDYPGGCTANGGAQFGDGYYDVVGALGGSFLSICADDWGISMDTLARDSVVMSTFSLTEHAVDGTIEVMVDGAYATDWYYDDVINAVQFNSPPVAGSNIEITYAVWACEGE